MANEKHVFILGAGFSAPLGGPLFGDLLTAKFDGPIKLIAGEEPDRARFYVREMSRIVKSLRHGPAYRKVKNGCEFDLDTESLLEFIEDLSTGNDRRLLEAFVKPFNEVREIRGLGDLDLKSIQELAQHLTNLIRIRLAIETSYFTRRLPAESERWDPYKKWMELLDKNSTIITFNYDTVVETVARFASRDYAGKSPKIVSYTASVTQNPPLFKLHGSADWYIPINADCTLNELEVEKLGFVEHGNSLLFSRGHRLLMGTPGCSKSTHKSGILRPLWEAAEEKIKEANIVSIIGYSMPETDNLAREFILDAIAGGAGNKHLIMLVLGPDSGTPKAKRIKALIEPLVECPVIDSGYYAQDYISRFKTYASHAMEMNCDIDPKDGSIRRKELIGLWPMRD